MGRGKEKDKGGRQVRQVEDRRRLGKLFPKAVSFMEAVLNDTLLDVDGKPIRASIAQKIDVALRVVDQHIGRPAQALDLTSKTEIPPASHTEVVLTYETLPNLTPQPLSQPTPKPEPEVQQREPLPFEPVTDGDYGDEDKDKEWIDNLEADVHLAGSDESHPSFSAPAV